MREQVTATEARLQVCVKADRAAWVYLALRRREWLKRLFPGHQAWTVEEVLRREA